MNRTQTISAGRAKTGIATPERRFEVFQGAAGLTAIREDWKRVTRAFLAFHATKEAQNGGVITAVSN